MAFKDDFKQTLLKIGISKLIELFLWSVVAVATSAGGSKFLASFFPALAPYRWSLFAGLCAIGFLIVIAAFGRFSRFQPRFPLVTCDYRILRKTLHYTYLDKINFTHTKVVVIQALRNGVNSYHDRYIWTGEGEVKVNCAVKGQTFRTTGMMSAWNCYVVDLGRTLKKGEECEIELGWDLKDTAERAQPFLATTVREPTDELIMKVTLPYKTDTAICEVRTDGSMLLPLETKEFPFDRHNTAVWSLRKPKLLHHYQMRWHAT